MTNQINTANVYKSDFYFSNMAAGHTIKSLVDYLTSQAQALKASTSSKRVKAVCDTIPATGDLATAAAVFANELFKAKSRSKSKEKKIKYRQNAIELLSIVETLRGEQKSAQACRERGMLEDHLDATMRA